MKSPDLEFFKEAFPESGPPEVNAKFIGYITLVFNAFNVAIACDNDGSVLTQEEVASFLFCDESTHALVLRKELQLIGSSAFLKCTRA